MADTESLSFYTEKITEYTNGLQEGTREEEEVVGLEEGKEEEVIDIEEIMDMLKYDPESLKEMFPIDHPEQSTIDIAVDWSNTGCDSYLLEVADLIKHSLESMNGYNYE